MIALTFITIITSVLLGLAVHHYRETKALPHRHFGS